MRWPYRVLMGAFSLKVSQPSLKETQRCLYAGNMSPHFVALAFDVAHSRLPFSDIPTIQANHITTGEFRAAESAALIHAFVAMMQTGALQGSQLIIFIVKQIL